LLLFAVLDAQLAGLIPWQVLHPLVP
jgi:hypothetical protein